MIRALYSLMMRLAQPFMLAKLKRRAVAEPGYAVAVLERLGHYSTQPAEIQADAGGGQPVVWVHAVSLGETRAAAILIARLRQTLPGMRLLLTHGTATGRAEGTAVLQAGDLQVWQPWDTPGAVGRFLKHFKPHIGILMETEVWPNLCAQCQAQGVPLVLANARLSEKSLQQALRLAWLARPAYQALAAVWAQTEADARRLTQLGAPVAGVFGNLKFDAAPDAGQLARGRAWRDGRALGPVILFASSREGEEAEFLKIIEKFEGPGLVNKAQVAPEYIATPMMGAVQWLLVPRHPQRFDEVAALVEQAGFAVSRRSSWGRDEAFSPPAWRQDSEDLSQVPPIWLGDSLGEMALYYGMADVALLGGSFEPLGGQNLIEAAACGCPLVMGPHTFNFAEAAELAEQAGAAVRVENLLQGVRHSLALAADTTRRKTVVQAAEGFSAAHRGATEKLARAIVEKLKMVGTHSLV